MAQRDVRVHETNTAERITDLRETVASVLYGMSAPDAVETIQALSEELLDVYERLVPELAQLTRQLTIYSKESR